MTRRVSRLRRVASTLRFALFCFVSLAKFLSTSIASVYSFKSMLPRTSVLVSAMHDRVLDRRTRLSTIFYSCSRRRFKVREGNAFSRHIFVDPLNKSVRFLLITSTIVLFWLHTSRETKVFVPPSEKVSLSRYRDLHGSTSITAKHSVANSRVSR